MSQKNLKAYREMKENLVYILDGTSMLYRSYYGKESLIKFRNMKTSKEYSSISCGALIAFATTFARFVRDFEPKYVVAAFDSGKSFRHDIFPPYKQQRVKV